MTMNNAWKSVWEKKCSCTFQELTVKPNCYPLCVRLLKKKTSLIKCHVNCVSSVPLCPQCSGQQLTSHRNNENAALTNKFAPESLKTLQRFSITLFHCFRVEFSFNKLTLINDATPKCFPGGHSVIFFRFAKVEDQKDALRLYTVQIPHKRERKPPPCYLTKWDGRTFLPLLIKPCGNEVISCLSVR